MRRSDALCAAPAHRIEFGRVTSQRLDHRIGQGPLGSGRNQPPRDARYDELADPSYGGADHGPSESERLHDHDGQPFGVARQHQRTRIDDVRADFGAAFPALESYASAKTQFAREALEGRALRPVADQRDLELDSIVDQKSRGAKQDRESFLGTEARDTHEAGGGGDALRFQGQELPVDTATDDVDLVLVSCRSPEQELTAAIVTDRHRERSLLDLARQRDRGRRAEIGRAVRSEAEGRSAELAAQERDIGRIGGEVGMHVFGARARGPAQEDARFRQVRKMAHDSTWRTSPHDDSRSERAQRPEGTRRDRRKRGRHQTQDTPPEDHTRQAVLHTVALVDEWFVRGADGDALDVEPRLLYSGDLTPNERVARLRILVRQVENLHALITR